MFYDPFANYGQGLQMAGNWAAQQAQQAAQRPMPMQQQNHPMLNWLNGFRGNVQNQIQNSLGMELLNRLRMMNPNVRRQLANTFSGSRANGMQSGLTKGGNR